MSRRPLMIGLAGGSGSGKTFLAQRVLAEVQENAALLSMDQYFRSLTPSEREDLSLVNFDHPGHLALDLLIEHLERLKSGQSVRAPSYDFVAQLQTPEEHLVEPKSVVIVEGLFVLAEPVWHHFDLTVFLDVAADQRLIGRILRDVKERGSSLEEAIDRYQRFVRPSYDVFVEPTKYYADVVVDFTFRRAFFQELLCRAIALIVASGNPISNILEELRDQSYVPGMTQGGTQRAGGVNILELIRYNPDVQG